ncbi:flagellar hook assembly protein FlgD, partial [Burkholderia sp. SIMBA_057]
MTSVNSDYAAAGASTTSSAKSTSAVNSSTNLGKDEFLKILMTQVQNQDPLNPVDDKEFISQMATFSSLEQMMNMNTTMTKFVENQDPFTMYVNWIGKNVTFNDSDGKD